MTVILHDALPEALCGAPRLPGTMPCDANDWLRVDATYGAQMGYRAQLLANSQEAVLHENDSTLQSAGEVLHEALLVLPDLGFLVADDHVTCPDGRRVPIDNEAPLWTLGHLVQEDICVLEKRGDEHILTSAVLCFPANWRLAEKINRPLTTIHEPVEEYDSNIARRVQRLFDGVQVGRPLWRFNKLSYADPDLHQPYRRSVTDDMRFVRSERQCILRMPRSKAVIFTIHSFVVRA